VLEKTAIFETVAKIMGHVYPLRALCNVSVV